MAFLIDEELLPATFPSPPMTDDEFAELCAEHVLATAPDDLGRRYGGARQVGAAGVDRAGRVVLAGGRERHASLPARAAFLHSLV